MARFTRERLERESRNRDERNIEPFEYESDDGQVFVFKHPKRVHIKTSQELTAGGIHATMRALLGDEPYERFVELPEADLFLMEDLFNAYNEHHGVNQGE